jgi:hypothetical protein
MAVLLPLDTWLMGCSRGQGVDTPCTFIFRNPHSIKDPLAAGGNNNVTLSEKGIFLVSNSFPNRAKKEWPSLSDWWKQTNKKGTRGGALFPQGEMSSGASRRWGLLLFNWALKEYLALCFCYFF